jgi:hypothetical protein
MLLFSSVTFKMQKMLPTFSRYHTFFTDKKSERSQKSRVSYLFCLMMGGSGSGYPYDPGGSKVTDTTDPDPDLEH